MTRPRLPEKRWAMYEVRFSDQKHRAEEILRIIPGEELTRLASETKVDYYTKVLTGERVFYMLVCAFTLSDRASQRKLEDVFQSKLFTSLFNVEPGQRVCHSSISERLSKIDVYFFERAYETVYERFSGYYAPDEIAAMRLVRVDSTMVAEACNKLRDGFAVGGKSADGKEKKQIKYTMAFDGFQALMAKMFDEASFLSEDKAMPVVLRDLIKKDKDHRNLYLLDRGLSALDNYNEVSDSQAKFVGRIKTNRKMEFVGSLMKEDTDKDLGKLELIDDVKVHLYGKDKKEDPHVYRVVKARFKEPRDTTRKNVGSNTKTRRVENEVYFITNDFDLSAKEVAEAYRRRWDIEVFFRFLKQNLSFSHLLSTSENGIMVVLYMTLITAMLIMIYKHLNKIGFSIAKWRFMLEMMDLAAKVQIVECGGNPENTNMAYIIRTRIP